jgi:putative flippase GtrA
MSPFHTLFPLSPQLHKLFRYICSGVTAAAGNLLILFTLVHYFGVHYLPASVCAVLGSMALGFTLQKFWTFRDHKTENVHVQFLGYVIIGGMNLLINTTLVYFFVSVLGVWYLLAQIFAGFFIAITGYFGYQRFVFKQVSSPQ